MYGPVRVIYPSSLYTDRKNHTTTTAPLPVCSVKLSIIWISQYYIGGPRWNPECYYFRCLKCQYNGTLLHQVVLGLRDKPSSSSITSGGEGGEEDERIYLVQSFLRMCMYFMIWWLHINLTVYHQYPTMAILAHKHLGIDALLELEMTKSWFSFQAQPPKMQHMHQSLSRCWARIYPKEIKMIIC